MPSAALGSESLAPPELERKLAGGGGDTYESDPESGARSIVLTRTVPRWLLLAMSLAMLASGTFDSVITKVMNRQELPTEPGGEPKNFEAPFFQTWTMYLGEWLLMALYYGNKWYKNRRGEQGTFEMPSSAKSFAKPHCPVWIWVIPCIFDFAASTMINYAIVFTQTSIVAMLRNFNVVLTAALTMLYLRNALRIHQYLGVICITIGLIITGLFSILNPDKENNYDNSTAAIGIIMSVAGTALSAFQFVFEERMLRKYYCSPFEAVGWMGFFGTLMGSLALVLGEVTGFEDVSGTFYQMGLGRRESTILIVTNIAFVISIAIFNGSGLSITKLGSGLLRTVVQTGRTITIWLLSLAIGYETFDALQLVGLLVIAVAIFLYNYNYVVPRDAWAGDATFRKPVVFACLKNPDADDEVGGAADGAVGAGAGVAAADVGSAAVAAKPEPGQLGAARDASAATEGRE